MRMMRPKLLIAAGGVLLLSGCGDTTGERALTAGLTGAAAGGLAGGPVGALVGGGVGATLGAISPVNGITMGKRAADMVIPGALKGPPPPEPQPAVTTGRPTPQPSPAPPATTGRPAQQPPPAYVPQVTPDLIKAAQRRLHHDGFYNGRIDGIAGPQTEKGLHEFQRQHRLPETGRLDGPTLNAMNLSR